MRCDDDIEMYEQAVSTILWTKLDFDFLPYTFSVGLYTSLTVVELDERQVCCVEVNTDSES